MPSGCPAGHWTNSIRLSSGSVIQVVRNSSEPDGDPSSAASMPWAANLVMVAASDSTLMTKWLRPVPMWTHPRITGDPRLPLLADHGHSSGGQNHPTAAGRIQLVPSAVPTQFRRDDVSWSQAGETATKSGSSSILNRLAVGARGGGAREARGVPGAA